MAGQAVIARAEVLHLRHRLSRTRFFSTGSNDTRDSLLIRVEDRLGVVGWGETYLVAGAHDAAEAVCRSLVRQYPEAAAVALARLSGAHRWVLSAVTMAMDDLRARRRGIPLARLYGDPMRTRVRPYASSAGYSAGRPLVETWSAEAAAVRAAGFGALKLRIGRGDPAVELAAIREVQRAVPGLDWMADVNAAWSAETTGILAPELAELGLRWLEEPMPTDDLPAYARIRPGLAMPLAGGEGLESPGEAAAAVAMGAFDIIQPDASICGGVAPLLRIAAAARAQGIGCIPHACNGAISLAATLQVLAVLSVGSAALEAGPLLEHDVGENPMRTDLLVWPLVIRDGWMDIPDGPGLGIEVDEAVVAALRVS